MFTFDVLCTIGIKFLPCFIKGVIVFISDTILNIISSLFKMEISETFTLLYKISYLSVVFQDDSNVHVDNDQVGQDQVKDNVGHTCWIDATIARVANFIIWRITIFLISYGHKSLSPTSRSTHLKKQNL